MAIKKPIPITFNLDSRQSVQSVCAVIHIDDKNTETLDLSLMQGGEHIAVSHNSTVTARFVRVKNNTLISDDIACTVQENGNIYIPIDNAAAHMLVGEIKIEVNIVDENDVLTMQFPLVIRVNNTILADAEISPESEGTIPELLEEAREAAESATQAAEAATEAISTKQDKLTAGQNITITEENVISASSVSNDYTDLTNKPSINNVTLSGNKTSDDLNLQDKLTAGKNITIDDNNVISAEGGVTDYDELTDKPCILIRANSANPSLQAWEITNEIRFAPYQFYGEHSIWEGRIYVYLDNLVFRYHPELTEYDFNRFAAAPYNGCLELQHRHVSNFPNALNKIDTSKPYFVTQHFNTLHGGNSNRHAFRKVSGYSRNGDFIEYAQICFINYFVSENEIISQTDWVELTGGGAQIVSGVVNANGTITFTDSEGNTFTTSGESVIGADGFSPVATVTQTASGATVSITDSTGTTTANITNGQDGNDYVLTAQDKSDIADIVLSELPTTQGVLYGNQSN